MVSARPAGFWQSQPSASHAEVFGMDCEPLAPEVDPELRRLVDLLNLIDGVETASSCAGHGSWNPTSEIEFSVDDMTTLRRVLEALPFLGARGTILSDPVLESIHVVAALNGDRVKFRLLISAAPPAAKRDLVRQVEGAIAGILAGRARHYPCSRPGKSDSTDRQPACPESSHSRNASGSS